MSTNSTVSSPDTATADDVRRFQLHLVEAGLGISNRNRIMTGVKFLFRVTLRRHDLAAEIYHLKEEQKLPLTVSLNEAERLLGMAGSLRDHVMLSLGYGCGLRAAEIVRARLRADISANVHSHTHPDRHVMTPARIARRKATPRALRSSASGDPARLVALQASSKATTKQYLDPLSGPGNTRAYPPPVCPANFPPISIIATIPVEANSP